jgi:hypothetical protein
LHVARGPILQAQLQDARAGFQQDAGKLDWLMAAGRIYDRIEV